MRMSNSFNSALAALAATTLITRVWADAYVQVSIDGFSPAGVTIAPGEAVYWMVADDWGPYSISSDSGAWGPRYLYDPGDVEFLQFNQMGDFTYYDAFNLNYGVVHVSVGVPNLPPTVSITSPADGVVLTAPASFSFLADATDLDNGVSDVEFYIDSVLVDDVFGSPFGITVSQLAPGSYTLQVVAYDLAGASATSSISITVQTGSTPRITLSQPSVASGQLSFQASGLTAGKQVVLESTTSLAASATWTPLQTNVVNGSSTTFASAFRPGNHFFRAVQLP